MEKAKAVFTDSDEAIEEFHARVRNMLEEHYFYISQIENSDKFMISVVTQDGSLHIPIAIAQNVTPGLYSEIDFDEVWGVVGLSSNGNIHKHIDEVVNESVFIPETGAVYAPTPEVRKKNTEEFSSPGANVNEGKPQVFVSYKP